MERHDDEDNQAISRRQYALSSSLQVDLQVLAGKGPESVRVPKTKPEL